MVGVGTWFGVTELTGIAKLILLIEEVYVGADMLKIGIENSGGI